MSFIEQVEKELNITTTLNGDKAFVSTGNKALDYFTLVGGYRYCFDEVKYLFAKAYLEDRIKALKLLLYTRDIKGGIGERELFRSLINFITNDEKDFVKNLIPYIPQYGRFDDLFALLGTKAENEIISYISDVLHQDIENKKLNKPYSLLAKWMPSLNTSNEESRKIARYLALKLGMSYKEYRQTLSYLRKNMIVENNLREKNYDFKYSSVPSAAMSKYRNAFERNDKERFDEYIMDVSSNKEKMNTEVLDVVTFVKRVNLQDNTLSDYYNTTWNNLVGNDSIKGRSLVVRDGSGSMTCGRGGLCPLDIANAMSLLTAARLTGPFKNKFITFSSRPEFVDLSCFTKIEDKLKQLHRYNDCSNTNIEKVFNLIYDIYTKKGFNKEDALDRIIIISDMQFDQAIEYRYNENVSSKYKSCYELYKEKFERLGIKAPEIVFWNVCSYGTVPVRENAEGVKLISGSSKAVIDLITKNESINPVELMDKVLEKYKFVEELA